LINRTRAKAEAVADEIRRRWPTVRLSFEYPASPIDLVLNATSLGLKPGDELPFDAAQFPPRHARAAYDMIYRPVETEFLRLARTAGCRTANGLGMLLYQGARALELWSGQPAPVEVMRQALRQSVYGT
jgi:shikimate dehydrogenase